MANIQVVRSETIDAKDIVAVVAGSKGGKTLIAIDILEGSKTTRVCDPVDIDTAARTFRLIVNTEMRVLEIAKQAEYDGQVEAEYVGRNGAP